MNLIKKFGFISLCIFLFISCLCNSCYSGSIATVYLKSNKERVNLNEEFEITMYIKDNEVAAFNSNFYFDDTKLEYVSGPDNVNVKENRIIYVWFDENGGNSSKSGEIAKFVFRAKEEGLATFSINGEFYNSYGELIETNFEDNKVQIGERENTLLNISKEEQGKSTEKNNAKLQNLRLDIEGINPNFDKNINQYYLNVENNINNINVLAVAENPNANIEVKGNTNLELGLNEIKVQVVSEDKTISNEYSIQVTKTENLEEANANLEILAIENGLLNPNFEVNVAYYNVSVSSEISDLNVLAVPENEISKVEIIGNQELKEGNNLIKIVVTAQNGFSKKVYEVNCYKRNKNEDIQYQKEQDMNKEKLQEIYQAEKLNIEENNEIRGVENLNNSNFNYILLAILITILLVLIIIIVWKKKGKAN